MKCYTADFETTTDVNDCRVWAYACCEIGNPDLVIYGNSLDDFIIWCECAANCKVYFHNLAFDGAFIFDWLERNGWTWVESTKEADDCTYTAIISDMNQVYSITLYFTKNRSVKIYDSLKIIPLSIEAMAKAYGLPIMKGDLDYRAFREVGHVLTAEEKDYIRNDVQIAAMVLDDFLESGLTKITAGSNALADFKSMMGGHRGFRKMYPCLDEDVDKFIRLAYRGGFTYVNPLFQGKIIDDGIVFDVNSLYPSVMAATDWQELPYGQPTWFDDFSEIPGEHLWVAQVTCSFSVKPDHIPCIQLKGNFRFKQTEYLTDSDGTVTFTVTNVDWDLITQQYDLEDICWHGGYWFKSNPFQFRDYVGKWVEEKNKATIEGNAGKRQIAKLMLNSLYGKFATRTTVYSRKPEMIDDVVRYVDIEPTERDAVYLPVGVFITSWARYKTITSAQKVYGRFIYADTDSLHLVGTDIPDTIDVDPVRLGAWKHESTFTHAKFLRAKTYVEEIDGELVVHCAGMPSRCHEHVTIENFEFGATYPGKLYTKRVKGGIVLVDGDMEIRE